MEDSKRLAEAKALQYAIDHLLSEPDSNYDGKTVKVRFTLPNGSKYIRTFRSNNSVQVIIDKLKFCF